MPKDAIFTVSHYQKHSFDKKLWLSLITKSFWIFHLFSTVMRTTAQHISIVIGQKVEYKFLRGVSHKMCLTMILPTLRHTEAGGHFLHGNHLQSA